MKTVQIYRTGTSCANASAQTAQNNTQTAKSDVLLHQDYAPHLSLLLSGPFSDQIEKPEQMQKIREALRSWFMAWIPDWEGKPGPTLNEAIGIYQDLDEFLSDLVLVCCEYQLQRSAKTKQV